MPKKTWIVATAALAVVKGKKLTNKKRDKANKKDKQRSDYSCARHHLDVATKVGESNMKSN